MESSSIQLSSCNFAYCTVSIQETGGQTASSLENTDYKKEKQQLTETDGEPLSSVPTNRYKQTNRGNTLKKLRIDAIFIKKK